MTQHPRLALAASRWGRNPSRPFGQLVDTIGAGDVIGWAWLFPPFSWHFQAWEFEPVKTIALSGAHLRDTAESNHAFRYELMKRVSRAVSHRLQAARTQLRNTYVELSDRH